MSYLPAVVNQGVLVNPTDAGAIGPQGRLRGGRQSSGDLVQVFEHSRARPVEVGLVIEDDVDVGVAEKRIAAHRACAGHRQHRGGQRIGDLILDHLRRLPGEFGANDDLRVGQVRQRIERR